MKTTRLFFFISLLILTSCKDDKRSKQELKSLLNKESLNENNKIIDNFIGKLYIVGPSIFENNVELGCDCCSSNIYFVDKNRFIEIAYCLDGDTYLKGIYKVYESRIEFVYDKNSLSKENTWEQEVDSTSIAPEFNYVENTDIKRMVVWKIKVNKKYFETSDKEFSEINESNKDEFLKKIQEDNKVKDYFKL
jgi:hypothetical protein